MSHAVIQTAVLARPVHARIPINNNNKSSFTKPTILPMIPSYPIAIKSRKLTLFIRDSNSTSSLHRRRGRESVAASAVLSAALGKLPSAMLSPTMMGQYGASGAVTVEKPKLDVTQKETHRSSPELATGGGGGDIGKKVNFGGGDGGDGGGDDDNYFDDFEDGNEGDEGLFRRRIVFQELFDRKFLDAVLNEWQKTIMDLPTGFRQAFEMGLVSSAQMVKFLAVNARPNSVRTIAGGLPQGLSRAFIGRMLADPAFLYRLLLEQAATIGCSAWWEFKNRKDRIKQEWDLALVDVLTAAACNAVVVWSLAPCRSYGNTFRFDLQNTLQKIPNNVFEKSYPLREFDLQKRVHSFFYKAAQLCFVGLTAGAVQGALSNLCAKKKNDRLSVTMPSVRTNALGTGAFLGLYANLRYQLLFGSDRWLSSYFDVIGVALFFSTALRIMNIQIGETSRFAWLEIEADPLVQSDTLMKAYNRALEANVSNQGSTWLISKNTIVSVLGFLGLPQSKPRRKRVVKKKVTTA